MKQEITLHRAMSEIKSIEAKLQEIPSVVAVANKKDGIQGMSIEEFQSKSQGAVDEYCNLVQRLVALKVARNKANATNCITVCGQQMTLDEGIARKAVLNYNRNLLNIIKHQMNQANAAVQQASLEVERKVEAQVQSIAGSTKKISEEELGTIRKMLEKSTGKEIVMGKNVKAFIEKLEKSINEFSLEIDFALSEANACIKVEIEV